jgi:hypothetical protein
MSGSSAIWLGNWNQLLRAFARTEPEWCGNINGASNFDCFVDFIGSHGSCASQTCSNRSSSWFGISGLKEDFPQLLGVWVF